MTDKTGVMERVCITFPIKSWESKASSTTTTTTVSTVQESGLKARQAKRARKRASEYNILTRFLFNYRPVMASLRSLITSSPTGFELIPDARLQPRFPRNLEKKKETGEMKRAHNRNITSA